MGNPIDWNAKMSEAMQAIADNPGDKRAHLMRAQATIGLGRPALARRLLEAFLRSSSDDPRALDLHSATCLLMGDAEKAAESAALALESDPDYCPARYNLACALARLDRGEEAIDALVIAVGLDPELRAMAAQDEDFVRLRQEPRFKDLVTGGVASVSAPLDPSPPDGAEGMPPISGTIMNSSGGSNGSRSNGADGSNGRAAPNGSGAGASDGG